MFRIKKKLKLVSLNKNYIFFYFRSDGISLTQGLYEAKKAIDMFFNNDFEGARDLTYK